MDCAVIGGGVLGMSLAQRLSRDGHDVTLYEAGAELGGLAAPWQLGEVTWDRHYHVTLLSDRRTRAMYDSVGIADDQIDWVETKTGYYGTDGTLRSVSNALEFLRLPGLSLIDKGRLGATIVYGSKIRSGERMERQLVETWLRRWSGSSAFETFWKPLLRAKLGDRYTEASSAFIWATIQRLYAARRTGLKKEMFGYVRGGYATVVEAFERTFADQGVSVRTSTPIGGVRRAGAGGLDVTIGDEVVHHDRVFVTTAAPLAAALCPDLLDGERRRLERVEYVGIVCVSLLRYLTEHVSKLPHRLVYLPKYTTSDDPLFSMGDDEIIESFLPYLETMYPHVDRSAVITSRVSRVPKVFALPTLRYSENQPSIATSVPGLYLAGSANLPFATLNVDDTLSLLDTVLSIADLGDPSHPNRES